ncbi:hypothetical protein H2204_001645 [Knufia peltigerae]|uniref:Xylanolytic transcriptional activator regulatory domain-containing protein n=1 Tax=Knufia peltigerae TaxID=1002370 RepID=A0AA39D196_9EURO|nr:hypothetical protein H2204_001645 [Knufia peltigerae]
MTCVTSKEKISRPYYQTSKEQFQLMHTIVQHFLPGVSVEKNDLREAVSCLSKEKAHAADQEEVSNPRHANLMMGHGTSEIETGHSTDEADDQRREDGTLLCDTADFMVPRQQQSHEDALNTDAFDAENEPSTILWENGTSPWLDKSLDPSISGGPDSRSTSSPCSSLIKENCVFSDEMHVPRFHSGSSMSTFYSKITSSALASIRDGIFQRLPPMEEFLFDGVPKSLVSPVNLPARAIVSQAATAFFAEINNIIYVLSYERFQIDLEKVYSFRPATTNAKLAIIHLMVSLIDPDADLFSFATRFGNASIEEGTLESVQALMIMTLCHLLRSQRNLAWVVLGSAVRIAQSLGLHLPESCWEEESKFQTENRKRIWWSLYELDTVLSVQLGRPLAMGDPCWPASEVGELDFDHNPFTPPGAARAASRLSILLCEVAQNFYLRPPDQVDVGAIADNFIDRLQLWWDELPLYLRPECPAAPSHTRVITYLSLRYQYIIMLVCRPFLLQAAADRQVSDAGVLRRARLCESANDKCIFLLKQLARERLVSNINYFDGFHILSNALVLFLRALKEPGPHMRKEVEEYLPLIQLTSHLRFGKYGRESFHALSNELKRICALPMYAPDPQRECIATDENLNTRLQDHPPEPFSIPPQQQNRFMNFWDLTDSAWFDSTPGFDLNSL